MHETKCTIKSKKDNYELLCSCYGNLGRSFEEISLRIRGASFQKPSNPIESTGWIRERTDALMQILQKSKVEQDTLKQRKLALIWPLSPSFNMFSPKH